MTSCSMATASWMAARSRMVAGENTGAGAGLSSLAAASLRKAIMLAKNSSGLSPFGKPTSLGGNSLYA
ncbi:MULTISPECIES: hypothetical protein [unclassified Bradyrhizobium]|uniref:hypothetical protein n=1 Tax=unclassified Bradyrhizobium TaxID=2631580 RepID=UPI001FF8A71F|nr:MULTISPECIES: hypothetical protein [unclassified Bradyrhizobium]MCK1309872.1 hypothetical protein [Bradyrhizobium sp. 45]MCK1435379.1 hypothetical protein [Bradyrhizobium sp. 15]MCK1614918.1 hypothetical protein [Bradyrhizobium sp. 163]MCK1760228.1 hypothetical protein [Bradyrhizobium sp. 136]